MRRSIRRSGPRPRNTLPLPGPGQAAWTDRWKHVHRLAALPPCVSLVCIVSMCATRLSIFE